MIQRIQSVFLLASALLLALMTITNLAYFTIDNQMIMLTASKFVNLSGSMLDGTHTLIQLIALIIITAGINFVTIFLFKKRTLQIRLCIYSIILQLSVLGMIGFYIFLASGDAVFHKIGIGSVIPVITLILTILALQNIRKDDKLVKSLDRIR